MNSQMNNNSNIALYIKGNSMAPTMANGDMVICRELAPLEAIQENEIYAIVTNTGDILVKRVQEIKNSKNKTIQLKLVPDNHAGYQSLRISMNNIRTLLKVEKNLAETA